MKYLAITIMAALLHNAAYYTDGDGSTWDGSVIIDSLILSRIDEITASGFEVHSRSWQLPVNASLLITQYDSDDGVPAWESARQYALTATSDTLINIQWVQAGFEPEVVTSDSVLLVWNKNMEADLSHYNVYRAQDAAGVFDQINTRPISHNSFEDSNRARGQDYYYKISAVDNVGNESDLSDVVE